MASIVNTTREYKLIKQHETYHTNVSGEVAAGSTINIHIENPADSGVRAVLAQTNITTTGPATIAAPKGFTVDSTGTATDADNNAVGSGNTATVNVYQDTTYSSTDHTFNEYVGSGGTGAAVNPPVGGSELIVDAIILEDNDYIVEVTNDHDTDAHNISITVEFYETTPLQE